MCQISSSLTDTFNNLTHFLSEQSKRSNVHNFKHAAVIINRKGQILSCGVNYISLESKHAEQDCVEKYLKLYLDRRKLKNHIMIVMRFQKKDGEQVPENVAISEPCDNCKRFLIPYGIKQIYYSVGHCDGQNYYGVHKFKNQVETYIYPKRLFLTKQYRRNLYSDK